jgi:hypothetical protein
MTICKICKKEFVSLKSTKEYCPTCKILSAGHKKQLIQDKHLEYKQKRFSSE